MTREEASEVITIIRGEVHPAVQKEWEQMAADVCIEALDLAIAALRGPTREQVEKMWRGCEKCNGAGEYSRYAENLTKTLLAKYCPHCGRPLTDEAVQMVMERLEALHGDL